MCRQHVCNGEPERDQIGRITSIDVGPLYAMKNYISEGSEEFDFRLEVAEKRVILEQLLNDHGYDTLNYADYFTDFNLDKDEGYIRNNFGQDLRNFRRFLEFAGERGASTVYFSYG